MKSYHGESVYQVPFLEDQPQIIYRHGHFYKILFLEAIFCCLQTCNFCLKYHHGTYISVTSVIVRGTTISKLLAQTHNLQVLPEAVCYCLYTCNICILLLMMGCMCVRTTFSSFWVFALVSTLYMSISWPGVIFCFLLF